MSSKHKVFFEKILTKMSVETISEVFKKDIVFYLKTENLYHQSYMQYEKKFEWIEHNHSMINTCSMDDLFAFLTYIWRMDYWSYQQDIIEIYANNGLIQLIIETLVQKF